MRNRPICYFDLSIDGIPLGRLTFQLYNDFSPRIAEKFRQLCTGQKGKSYEGITFHKIVFNYMAKAGFAPAENSPQNSVEKGSSFTIQELKKKHNSPYLLTMFDGEEGINSSQFGITFV